MRFLALLALVGVATAQEPTKLSLADAIGIALRENPGLAAARSRVDAGQFRAAADASALKLSVNLSGYAMASSTDMLMQAPTWNGSFDVRAAPDRPFGALSLSAMYPIYTGGRLKSTVNASRSEASALSFDRSALDLEVAMRVRLAYYSVLLAKAELASSEQMHQSAEEAERVAKEQFEAGAITKAPYYRAQAETVHAMHLVEQASTTIEHALVALRTAMGLAGRPKLELTDDFPADPLRQSFEADDMARLLTLMEAHLPGIAAARERLGAAKSRVRAADGSYAPQVYLAAGTDAGVTSGRDSMSGGIVGLVLSVPLVDGGLRRAERNELKAKVSEAEHALADVRLNAAAEVENAYLDLKSAQQNITYGLASVGAGEEALRIVEARYKAGKAILLEQLEAVAALKRDRLTLAQSRYDYYSALARLERAAGSRADRIFRSIP